MNLYCQYYWYLYCNYYCYWLVCCFLCFSVKFVCLLLFSGHLVRSVLLGIWYLKNQFWTPRLHFCYCDASFFGTTNQFWSPRLNFIIFWYQKSILESKTEFIIFGSKNQFWSPRQNLSFFDTKNQFWSPRLNLSFLLPKINFGVQDGIYHFSVPKINFGVQHRIYHFLVPKNKIQLWSPRLNKNTDSKHHLHTS